MEKSIAESLPGFKMFNDFFADLKGDFEPVALSEGEKELYLRALGSLDGAEKMHFLELREDLELTAKVREARRYADGKMYVRFEFKRLKDTAKSCESDEQYSFEWSRPYQLMVLFDGQGHIGSYTVLSGIDKVVGGLEATLSYHDTPDRSYEVVTDVATMLEFFKQGTGWREAVIRDAADGEFFVTIHRNKDRKSFFSYWHVCYSPWILLKEELTYSQVESEIKALRDGGVRLLEDVIEWRTSVCDETTVCVDMMLRRSLELAKMRGDELMARTVRAVGVNEWSVANPFRFLDIPSGTLPELRKRVFKKACRLHRGKAAKLFAMLALRGDPQSQRKLGEIFRAGIGVDADRELSDYWLAQCKDSEIENDQYANDEPSSLSDKIFEWAEDYLKRITRNGQRRNRS